MKLLLQIITTLMLAYWPVLLMMSPMAFDAPGSENNRSQIIGLILFLCYPIPLAALYWFFGADLFGLSGRTLTLSALLVVVAGLMLFGYGTLLQNSLKGIASSGYSVASGQVYYNARAIPGAQAETLEVLAPERLRGGYARDQQRVYYRGEALSGADPVTFRPLDDGYEYWLDQQQVYLDGRILPDADPASFRRLPDAWQHPSDYAVSSAGDQSRLYYRSAAIGPVQPDEVTVLRDGLAKDRQHIYYQDRIILPMADAGHFELLPDTSEYGRDQQAVYDVLGSDSGPIAGADPVTIETLPRGYLKDARQVYHRAGYQPTLAIPGADSATFEVTGWDEATQSEARDQYAYYQDERVVKRRVTLSK